MQQLFINNWVGHLFEAVASGEMTTQVEPELAARLVGLGSGDFYLVTVAIKDSEGAEVAWEVMKVTGVSGGELTVERAQEGTSALSLPAGSEVSARVTAGALNYQAAAIKSLSDQIAGMSGGGLSKSNFVAKLLDGSSGRPGNIAYFDEDVGELLLFDPMLDFPELSTATPVNPDPNNQTVLVRDFGVLILYGAGAGANFAPDFALNTGTFSDGSAELRIRPQLEVWPQVLSALGAPAFRQFFSLDSSIDSITLGAMATVPVLSSGNYAAYLNLTLPNLSFDFAYDVASYGSAWNIGYSDAEGNYVQVDTGLSVVAGRMYAFTVNVTTVNGEFSVLIKEGNTELLSVPVSNLFVTDAARLGVTAQITKSEGSNNCQLRVFRAFGKVTLK